MRTAKVSISGRLISMEVKAIRVQALYYYRVGESGEC